MQSVGVRGIPNGDSRKDGGERAGLRQLQRVLAGLDSTVARKLGSQEALCVLALLIADIRIDWNQWSDVGMGFSPWRTKRHARTGIRPDDARVVRHLVLVLVDVGHRYGADRRDGNENGCSASGSAADRERFGARGARRFPHGRILPAGFPEGELMNLSARHNVPGLCQAPDFKSIVERLAVDRGCRTFDHLLSPAEESSELRAQRPEILLDAKCPNNLIRNRVPRTPLRGLDSVEAVVANEEFNASVLVDLSANPAVAAAPREAESILGRGL